MEAGGPVGTKLPAFGNGLPGPRLSITLSRLLHAAEGWLTSASCRVFH